MGWSLETYFEKWDIVLNYKTENKQKAIKQLDGIYTLENEYEELWVKTRRLIKVNY